MSSGLRMATLPAIALGLVCGVLGIQLAYGGRGRPMMTGPVPLPRASVQGLNAQREDMDARYRTYLFGQTYVGTRWSGAAGGCDRMRCRSR